MAVKQKKKLLDVGQERMWANFSAPPSRYDRKQDKFAVDTQTTSSLQFSLSQIDRLPIPLFSSLKFNETGVLDCCASMLVLQINPLSRGL